METDKTYVTIRSVDGYSLNYSIDLLKGKFHLKGTLIEKVFFSPNFIPEPVLELDFSKRVVELLIPLIRENRLVIPQAALILEFESLLKFLANDNNVWHHYSELMHHSIYDIFDNIHNISLSQYVGKYFTEHSSQFYSTTAFNLVQKIIGKFPNVSLIKHADILDESESVYFCNVYKNNIAGSSLMYPQLLFCGHDIGTYSFVEKEDNIDFANPDDFIVKFSDRIKESESSPKQHYKYHVYLWESWCDQTVQFVYNVKKKEL